MLPFHGNSAVLATLQEMAASGRQHQTILLHGPEGVGKATLVRRYAAALLPDAETRMEQDDLSLPGNQALLAERDKLPAEKRNESPLFLASHPDFVTFPPEGPLRQIGIPQMRALREQARLYPLRGSRRVFLIDGIDRANEQAANSLLKTLEEPPPYLVLFLTAENPYDLLPTIRSRAVSFGLAPLVEAEMRQFVTERGLDQPERRLALALGRPGKAVTLDLTAYDQRRQLMMTLLQVSLGAEPFSTWVKQSESFLASKSEKLDAYLEVLYILLEDLLLAQNGLAVRQNRDVAPALAELATRLPPHWLPKAVAKVDRLVSLLRRNIQKGVALDALTLELRSL